MKQYLKWLVSFMFLLVFTGVSFADYAPPLPQVYAGCNVPNYVNSAHNTWYIDQVNGSDSTGDGTSAKPWKNLQTVFSAQAGIGPFLASINPTTGVIQAGDVVLLNNGNYGSITIGNIGAPLNQTNFLTISANFGQTSVVMTKMTVNAITKMYFYGFRVQTNSIGQPANPNNTLIQIIDGGSSAKMAQDIIFNNLLLDSQLDTSIWVAADWLAKGNNGFTALGSSSGANIKCVAIQGTKVFNVLAGAQLYINQSLITNSDFSQTADFALDVCGNNILVQRNTVHDGLSTGNDPVPGCTSSTSSNIDIFDNIIMRQTGSPLALPPIFYEGINNFDSDITNLNVHNNLVITDAEYGIGGSSLHNSMFASNTILQDGTVSSNGQPALWIGNSSSSGTPSSNVKVVSNFAPVLGNSDTPFINNGSGIFSQRNVFLYNAGSPVITDFNGSGFVETLAGLPGQDVNYTQPFSGGVNTVNRAGGPANQIQQYNTANLLFNLRAKNGSLLQQMNSGAQGFGNVNSSIFPKLAFNNSGGGGVNNVIPAFDDASANWAVAGLQSLAVGNVGGIASVDNARVACTTAQAGITLPLVASGVSIVSANDDAANIQKAIDNCPTNTKIILAAGSFTMDESEFIFINKSITLSGSGNCTNSTNHAYCNTTLVKRNGVLAYHTNEICGTSVAAPVSCSGLPVVMMSPNGPFNDDWSGCHDNTTGGTQDGNTCAGTVALVTTDAAQGDRTIHVNTTTPFQVGQWVLIDEDPAAAFIADPVTRGTTNPKVWASPDTFSNSGSPATGRIAYLYFSPFPGYGATTTGGLGTCTNLGCPGAEGEACAYAATCFRPVGEIHLITGFDAIAKTLTFDSPLTIAMRQTGGHNAHVYYPTTQAGATYTPFLQKGGLENITLGRGSGGDVQINHCAYCWVKTVDAWGWAGGAVSTNASVRAEITNVIGYDCFNNDNNGNEYAYSLNSSSTEILLTNSISKWSGKSMVARAGGAGSVVSYNDFDQVMYEGDSTEGNWVDLSANASHFPGSHHVLFEGNHAVNGGADMTHGSGSDYMTYFLNHLAGYRTTFVNPSNNLTYNDATNTPSQPGNIRAFSQSSYNYWPALVGNVMGTAGLSTPGNGWLYNTSSYQNGSNYNIFETYDEYTQNGQIDPHLNFPSGNAYIFQHGNFDYYHNSIVDWHPGFSQVLPNSLYLKSTPDFFAKVNTCSYPYPWVAPTSGTVLKSASGTGCTSFSGLPAMARFQAGTPLTQP